MTKDEFLKSKHFEFSSELSNSGKNIWVCGSVDNRQFCQEDLIDDYFARPTHQVKFLRGLCIECGEKREFYQQCYFSKKTSGVVFYHLYNFENGYCEKCAKARQTEEAVKSHDNDSYSHERISGHNDYIINRYYSEGWDKSVDPVYDIDCEKVEGFEKVSARDLWVGQNN